MLHYEETHFVVSDKAKAVTRLLQVSETELNRVNRRTETSIAAKMMSKVRGNVFFHEQGVTRILITGYTASGAKSARMFHRLLYGTREVIIA
jgi:hypothetical protein